MSRRFLSAEWRYLVMLNYDIDPTILRPYVPKGTELDSWNDRYMASMVGFLFLRTRVFGVPIPFHRNFEEVNLRFYVRRRTAEGWRRGVVFVKEVVPRSAIALLARWLYNENYAAHRMSSNVCLPDPEHKTPGSVEYVWHSPSGRNAVSAVFESTPMLPPVGSEEEFITEHYWGYVPQRDGSTMEYRVEHPQWRVWRASSARLECDVATFYGEQYVEALSQPPHSAFVAEGSRIAVYRGERIAAEKPRTE